MASIIVSLALSGSRRADGTANAGGRVFLTRPGSTSVSVTAWTNRNETASHVLDQGGVALDAAGKAAIFVSEPCDIRVEDTNGVTVSQDTEPSVNAGLVEIVNPGFTGVSPTSGQLVAGGRTYLDSVLTSLKSSLGGVDGKFRGTYGTADTNLNREVEQLGLTPQRFGAKGDGATDDTAAFLLLAAAQSASGIPIFIPGGTYQLSAAITFAGNRIVRGSGPGSTILRGTNATMDCIISPSAGVISDLAITHATTSTGAGLKASLGTKVTNVTVSALYATGASCTSGTSFATACTFSGSTAGTVGGWSLLNSSVSAGTVSGTSMYVPTTLWTDNSMANGGNVTPLITPSSGQVSGIAYNRIRGTSAGTGLINAIISPLAQAQLFILDCYNNSGGAFTFTFAAQYHMSAGAVAPANGTRRCIVFAWNPIESICVECTRTADVT